MVYLLRVPDSNFNKNMNLCMTVALCWLNELWLDDLAVLNQSAAATDPLPSQGILEKDNQYDRVCNDWKDFFEAQECLQKDLEMVQSAKDCQRHKARKVNPPIKTASMYE